MAASKNPKCLLVFLQPLYHVPEQHYLDCGRTNEPFARCASHSLCFLSSTQLNPSDRGEPSLALVTDYISLLLHLSSCRRYSLSRQLLLTLTQVIVCSTYDPLSRPIVWYNCVESHPDFADLRTLQSFFSYSGLHGRQRHGIGWHRMRMFTASRFVRS